MFCKLVVVVLAAFIGTSSAMGPVAAVATAVSVINEITSLITGMQGLVEMVQNDQSEEVFRETVIKKLDDIHAVCTKIDDVKGRIDELSILMKENTDQLLTSIEFNHAKRIVGDFKKNVDFVNKVYYDKFTAVWNKMKNYKPGSVDHHFQEVVDNNAFDRAMSEMLSDITSSPNSQSSIFGAMSKYYIIQNGYQFRCENISPLDDLHFFYGNVITTFARGYAVLLMSYQYLKMTSNDFQFYQDRQSLAFKNFKEAIETVTQHAKIDFDSIADSDFRASYACDPTEWKEGKTFIRVKNYVTQQYSENTLGKPVNNPGADVKFEENDCEYGWAQYDGVAGPDTETNTQVCTDPFSPDLENPYSVEYKELEHYWGRVWESRKCILGSSTYFYNNCHLDHQSDPILSIRKLSLRLQECDTSKNEVVTDARFYEQDNKIHIKLRCGVLKDRVIYPKTLRWTEDNEPFSETEPKEYVVLSSKLKSFNIDNVVVPNGQLVTGAGFKVVDDHFIALVVKGNKVNNYNHGNSFGDGNLYSAPKSANPRRNIDISHIERPPKKMDQTRDMSKAGETYINLTTSFGYQNKTVVPYFDMSAYKVKELEPSLAPLGGLGLFYKSLPGHAGFLAFKHLSPTYVQFVDTTALQQESLGSAQQPLRIKNGSYRSRIY